MPFNYPFHNVFNPLLAAVFAGNGIVIKVRSCCSSSARTALQQQYLYWLCVLPCLMQ